MNILQSISDFGSEDGEKDEKLLSYFYETPIIAKLIDYKANIIIGRKGTGKTALFRYLSDKYRSDSVELSFSDYPWKIHDIFVNKIVSERESFKASWEFLFYIEYFKKLVQSIDLIKNRKAVKAIKQIRSWLKKNWGNTDFKVSDVMQLKGKYTWSFNPQVLGCGLGSISRDVQNTDNPGNTITEYNKIFSNISEKLSPLLENRVILLFDELDLAYSSSDENYKVRLIGLLLAAFSFSSKLKSSLCVYIFLRNDIFNVLEFQEKRKIKENISIYLDWDADLIDSTLSLKQVAANRIRINIGEESTNFQRNWDNIFESNNIGKNQLKWNFFIERSFVRPRDLIKIMNYSLEASKERLKNDPASIDKITNDDIHSIKGKYSRYLYEELTDEIHSKYVDFDRYLDILRQIHTIVFTKDVFSNAYKVLTLTHSLPQENEILERLYEFSIIGFYKPGGEGKGGSGYTFQFASDHQKMNLNAERFRVHIGFKEHLELIE